MRTTLTTPVVASRPPWGKRGLLAAVAALALVPVIALGAGSALRSKRPEAHRGIAAAVLLASLRASTAAAMPVGSVTGTAAEPVADKASPAATKGPVTVPPPKPWPPPGRVRSSCDPPYYLDPTGIRRVKRECL